MLQPWIQALIVSTSTIIASQGFWAFLQRRGNHKSANTRLLMGLAYDKIMSRGMSYIERGWISKDEYEEFRKYLCEPYIALGGNGVAERVMREVAELPLHSNSKYSEIVRVKSRTKGHR